MPRLLEFACAADPGTFVVQRFSGQEALARLPEFHIELLSACGDIDPDALLGTNATVALEREGGLPPRYFNGHVVRFAVRGCVRSAAFTDGVATLYRATLAPGLWFLTRRADSRIHRRTTLGALLAQRLEVAGVMSVQDDMGPTEWRDYVVQYRESDFDFVSRLAEHVGASWHVLHDNGQHRLVLTDRPGALSGDEDIPCLAAATDAGGAAVPTLAGFEVAREIQPGAFAGGDYDYAAPNAPIAAVDADPSPHDNAAFEWHDHPLDTTDAEQAETYARYRREELACRHATGRGSTTDRSVRVGFPVRVARHPVAAVNGDWLVTRHVFTAVNNLEAGGGAGGEFHAEFEAIPLGTPFRPARRTPRPQVAGTQVARVVSGPGDDVADDDASGAGARLARVRVQFFWDRRGDASCWARVSQAWAGKGCGFQNLPRVGEEVLVQFLEGDPDRPVITGRVHNADQVPPYALPRHAAVTGLKTLSLDASGHGVPGRFSELRFDDSAGAEQVYLQAQRRLDERVLGDRHATVTGQAHESVGGDRLLRVGGEAHVQVAGDANVRVDGALSLALQEDLLCRVAGGRVGADVAQEIHLRAGTSLVLEAGACLTLRVAGSFVEISPAGLRLQGAMVDINGGGSAAHGAGAQPWPARAAVDALTSEGGARSPPPPAPAPPSPASAQGGSHRVAVVTAAPFCEPCQGC